MQIRTMRMLQTVVSDASKQVGILFSGRFVLALSLDAL